MTVTCALRCSLVRSRWVAQRSSCSTWRGRFTSSGVNVKVFSFVSDGFYKDLLLRADIPFIVIRQSNPVLRLAILARHFYHFQPHVIQTAQFFTGIYAGATGRFFGTSSIVNMRNELVYERRVGYPLLMLSIRLPSAVIANSQKALDEVLAAGYTSGKSTHWLPNVIDLTDFDSSVSESPNLPQGIRVVFVGRLTDQKRVDRFLRALAIAREQIPNLTGIVVGDGPDAETLCTLATTLGVPVTFLGIRDDIPQILRSCHILVLSSAYEGFPNVLIEAMAARLPTITTPAGDSARVVVDGETGYVVPFDDLGQMAARIVALAQDPERSRQMGEAGRARVEALYSYDRLSSRLLNIYLDLGQKDCNRRLLRALQYIKISHYGDNMV